MMAMIPMKRKLWMSETKDGVYAYFPELPARFLTQ